MFQQTMNPPKMNNVSKQLKVSTKMSLKRCFLYNTEEKTFRILQVKWKSGLWFSNHFDKQKTKNLLSHPDIIFW